MRTFYFNTGARPGIGQLTDGQVWRNGTKQIPFDCDDVPEGSTVLFLSNDPDCVELRSPSVICRPVYNTTMSSKYAYFRIPSHTMSNLKGITLVT